MTVWALLPPGAAIRAAEEPPSAPADAEKAAFFTDRVEPILKNHCAKCHGAEDKIRGGLRLDSREAVLKGGDLGPAVELDAPEESLLLEALRYEGLEMPPSGRLPDDDVQTIVRWIEMGLPWAAGADSAPLADAHDEPESIARSDDWPFDAIVRPPVPAVKESGWVRGPIDAFVLAKLEAEGLAPAPEADRRTLIRRLSYDLTGLPPSPQEVEAFVGDDSTDAYERLVDRLLASPHYGEAWGRHWLDLVGYGETNGYERDSAKPFVWRYRDYVIAAFNDDKPYDRFVREQLAGDQTAGAGGEPAARREALIATGFLSIGPKVLAEPDPDKMRMDIIDEQIDAVGRVFMGLTLGCARCHDHKFDPISTADYYALAGVFKSTRTMESFKTVARWHENPIATDADLALKAAHDARVAAAKEAVDRATAEADAQARASLPEGAAPPEKLEPLYPEEAKARLAKLRAELAAIEKAAPVMPSAMGVTEGTVADLPVHIRGSHLTLGDVVPRRTPTVFRAPAPPKFDPARSGRLELARWIVEPDHPLTARVMVNRIWRWHFGRGLVASTDNFGANGSPPSHPELLDWLARRFVSEGWSIKAVHRMILNSSTYRMAADYDADAFGKDPEGRFYWRWPARRLEAEEVRDALLAVAGTLDGSMGGSLLQVENRAYFFDHTSRDKTGYDTRRRSLYLPIVRNHLYDVFQLFDAPDGNVMNGDRASTTIAPQALFMLNSGLALESAKALADALRDGPEADDAGRVRALYEKAYGRPPSPSEARRALDFLVRFEGLPHATGDAAGVGAWPALCQVILASNEFVTIR